MSFPHCTWLRHVARGKLSTERLGEFAGDLDRLMNARDARRQRNAVAAQDKYAAMEFLLEDGEFWDLNPPMDLFLKWREDRRRIFWLYVAEFARELWKWSRLARRELAEVSDWERLQHLTMICTKRGFVLSGFVLAWVLHGFVIGDASRVVRRMLTLYAQTRPPKVVAISV